MCESYITTTLSKKVLEDMGACESGVKHFVKIFGSGPVRFTKANIQTAIDKRFDFYWFAEEALPNREYDLAEELYEEVKDELCGTYEATDICYCTNDQTETVYLKLDKYYALIVMDLIKQMGGFKVYPVDKSDWPY